MNIQCNKLFPEATPKSSGNTKRLALDSVGSKFRVSVTPTSPVSVTPTSPVCVCV